MTETMERAPAHGAPDRMVSEPERRLITGVSRMSWWRYERAGTAPRRVQLGPNRVAWRLSELLNWIDTRPAAEPGRCPRAAAE